MSTTNYHSEVTDFLDGLNHPFREEIEALRTLILTAQADLTENIDKMKSAWGQIPVHRKICAL